MVDQPREGAGVRGSDELENSSGILGLPSFDLRDRFNLPTTALAELVYVSRRSPRFADTAVTNMIADASVRNYLSGISGRLWVGVAYFFQVLEGNQSSIDHLFRGIERDTRHSDVLLVRRRRIEKRNFDRPMWLFRGEEDPTYRNYVDSLATEDAPLDTVCRLLMQSHPA